MCSTSQQNGIAEIKHTHVLEIARAMRFQGHIPLRFWGHYVLEAVYVINKLPSSVLAGKSTFEVFHKRKPNIEHIRTIGCLCFAKRMNVHDKFEARATTTALMGYSEVTKGYILYDLSKQCLFFFVVNRDVIFKESLFSFKYKRQGKQHLFVVMEFAAHDAAMASPLDATIHAPVLNIEKQVVLDDITGATDEEESMTLTDHVHHQHVTNGETEQITNEVPSHDIEGTRKSTRDKRVHVWMTDYVTAVALNQSPKPYPISNYVCYDGLKPVYQNYLGAFSAVVEPKTF
ncbi:uncharacterized protein [Nicotiana tomentosiformis]|uniref:uncharacterized protein n=1 Tax=Nicotiana tomentosiformis TaxID=4098 RepID=UPI00388C8532